MRGRLLLPRGHQKKKKRAAGKDLINLEKLKKGTWLTIKSNLKSLISATRWTKELEKVWIR